MPEIGAAQVEAALEQLFHVPFMLVDIKASHACAECGADRRTCLVEPYGDFVGQQAGCRVQCVSRARSSPQSEFAGLHGLSVPRAPLHRARKLIWVNSPSARPRTASRFHPAASSQRAGLEAAPMSSTRAARAGLTR